MPFNGGGGGGIIQFQLRSSGGRAVILGFHCSPLSSG